MEQLKEFAHIGLLNYDPEGDSAAIIDDLKWNVQDDPAMEGCSVDDVRRLAPFPTHCFSMHHETT